MSLTDTALKRLKPSEKCTANRPDKISDGNGLMVLIRHSGTKSFISAYSFNGKTQEITIGKYPMISLAQARSENIRIRELASQGINPKDERQKAKQKDTLDFDHFAQIWLQHQEKRINPATFKRDSNAYKNHIKPILGNMNIYHVKLSDVLAVHDRLALNGKTNMAHKAVSWISAIFEHTIIKGLAPNLLNPIPRGIHKSLVEHKQTNYPRIKITELPKLLADIDNANLEPLTKYAFYVMAYTFVRTNELFGMRWVEIDFNTCLWTIPPERMKCRNTHVVPLAPQVIEILQTIKEWRLHDEFVFFSNRSKQRETLSPNALTTALKRMGYKDKMTGHGFRGLASTSLYEMQYNPKAIELQLAHVSKDKTERAYNHADMIPKRMQMMKEWADIVDEIKDGDFSTYRKRLTADGSSDDLALFLGRIYKNGAILHGELATHQAELLEIKGMQ
ncbi:tyrosine-type recombinase/integrase [Moraxella nasovis]|uniref:tyrosine-type recombinase/integrase n=1 Tax=Moraxella nasovis TaxID=2904121 RepID=UPI001F61B86B|nr:tyrosine-type recombinase/integrase [Moraxella nasovis]UNU72914.1 tyrosine-type recombinase/integrase [Moraxella nasovis]